MVKKHQMTDQAVYRVIVKMPVGSVHATVLCCINSFDEAAELACGAVADSEGVSVESVYALSVEMYSDVLVVESEGV